MQETEIESARPRRRAPRATVAIATALVGALILSGCWSANQGKLMGLINDYRKANGKPALTGEQKAMSKAQAWAQHMANTGVVEHTGGGSALDTSGLPRFCALAENVAGGTSTQADFDAWTRSTVHRTNMLGNYNRVGTGVVRKGDKVYAVAIFYRTC
jgi:uncharacterized protein YkwD